MLKRKRSQHGVTLIEVMVSVFVAAIGVLGVAALQMNSIKFNQLANTRSYATMLAYDIIDRMRANRGPALTGSYDIAMSASAPNGQTIAATDVSTWLNELAGNLPAGDGSIARNGAVFTVTVQWDESRVSGTRESGSGNTESFVFITEL